MKAELGTLNIKLRRTVSHLTPSPIDRRRQETLKKIYTSASRRLQYGADPDRIPLRGTPTLQERIISSSPLPIDAKDQFLVISTTVPAGASMPDEPQVVHIKAAPLVRGECKIIKLEDSNGTMRFELQQTDQLTGHHLRPPFFPRRTINQLDRLLNPTPEKANH